MSPARRTEREGIRRKGTRREGQRRAKPTPPEPLDLPTVELRPHAMAAGGDALARNEEGRVVFVTGALPGETVLVQLTEQRRDFFRGYVTEVVEASADRVVPPCPHVEEHPTQRGCGGCQWQYITPHGQARLKVDIAVDQIRRLGQLAEVPLAAGTARRVTSTNYRTSVRAGIGANGQAGIRRRATDDPIAHEVCMVAHPLVEQLLVHGRFPRAHEVTIRCGEATGERLVMAHPRLGKVTVPDDVKVTTTYEIGRGRGVYIHEEAAGRRWRVSARSFFQSGAQAAGQLVDAVSAAAGDALCHGGDLIDAYCGVGLLGGSLAGRAAEAGLGVRLMGVEASPDAVADARVNLVDLDSRILTRPVANWEPTPEPPALVIADPARAGLGITDAAILAATRTPVLVLVSCDPAAAGRDTKLLANQGYKLTAVRVCDLFPGTPHVEIVSRFERARIRS